MIPTTDILEGSHGDYTVHRWDNPDAGHVVLLAHGIAEHARRYDHVANALVEAGGAVYAPDHYGHGLSAGERALVEDIEAYVDDLHLVADLAATEHPGLPIVVLGHSLGGIIATRYAQRYMTELAALVLSAPVIGGNPAFEPLLEMDPIPDVPLDPAMLSRDPAVGEAYARDDLVYHGPRQRPACWSRQDRWSAPSSPPVLLWTYRRYGCTARTTHSPPMASPGRPSTGSGRTRSATPSIPVRCTRSSTRPTKTR